MTLEDLIERLGHDDTLTFEEVTALIDDLYDFTPTAFTNGLGEAIVENTSEMNQGSCKILAFCQLQGLDQHQTLACFGQYYRDVLATPGGSDHANIRSFVLHGCKGVRFHGKPLRSRA